jgi:type I restriction enzyme R subunit
LVCLQTELSGMSEYLFVEKPFLDQLAALGWLVVDQGEGFPTNPARSFRSSFREVILRDIFNASVLALNTTEDGHPWLTNKQLEELYEQILHQPGTSLLEANENVLKLLYRAQVDVNELTGEEYPNVKLIDFHHPERNHFLAINQFRVDTPGGVKDCIIPDIVLFVNGLPLVVIECKDANQVQANPMYEAFRQLLRYTDQREETKQAGLREGEPRLFYTNQLVICTCGERAEFGTITATEEEFFFPWKDIWPEQYRAYEPPLDFERQQEVLIQGMLPKNTLLDIVHNCTLFMDVGKTRAKIVCRYQQYRAMLKIIHRLRTGKTPAERSGVIWHTQGSGKSLTMVFVIRKLRMCDDLKDFKVCLINNRTDLEEQLGTTATLTGEKVTYITSTTALRRKLSTAASNLNMVMVHKFQEAQDHDGPEYLDSALERIPRFKTFGIVNPSERILLMIDEAHRTQSGDLGGNLFAAFPNAARLAFTGTPLIVVQDREKTVERFGEYLDTYKLHDAVDDGATVQILYEGRTADTAIDRKHEFDAQVEGTAEAHIASQLRKAENVATLQKIAQHQQRSFDDLVRERTAEEILHLKKKWGTTGDILEADRRIEAIATDLVRHYIDNILPNGFKAQVVCSSKMAAVKYKKYIDQAVERRLQREQVKPQWTGDPSALPEDDRQAYRDDELCKKIAFLKSAVVLSSEGTNERAVIRQARKHAKEVKAIENFKRPFNYDDPDKAHTGIAFLTVCDMLLTGFDAAIEQVMYIDKKVKDHNLLQTIARVNRVARGKTRGYIVDYIGLANHLQEALSIYAAADQKDIQDTLKDITAEVPVLESRYQRLLNLFRDNGVTEIGGFADQTVVDPRKTFEILEHAIELLENIKLRATFEVYLKQFMQSMDIILPHAAANPYKIPVKRLGYILVKVKERYKDDSLDISGAGEKVKNLIDAHLISLGINPKIPPIELLSPNFLTAVEKNQSSKAKASEMEHAIRKHCKVHFSEDPALYAKLSEKLEALIQQYKDAWDNLYRSLFALREEVEAGRTEAIEGVSQQAAPFYDLIGHLAFGTGEVPHEYRGRVRQLVNEVVAQLQQTINIVNFWHNAPEVSKLKGALSDLMLFTGIDEIAEKSDRLVTEITALAKVRHRDIVR